MRVIIFSLLFVFSSGGAKPNDNKSIRSAVEAALPLLDATALITAGQRKCFTCHGQGLPILVFVEARKHGFSINEENLLHQVNHTLSHLTRGQENYHKGIGQGGKADMAGSALWAIKTAGLERSQVTDAVIDFLIVRNSDQPYWVAAAERPPAEGSLFTSTFLALKGFEAFAYDQKQEAIEKRRAAALKWLCETSPETTEDMVHHLRALTVVEAPGEIISKSAENLVDLQRRNGGWAQLPDLEIDAYATASALIALFESGHLKADTESYRRGLRYLLDAQLPNGSWYVESRSSPIQKYYESGFPHGKHQFLSSSATALAVLALLNAIPETGC